jgi:hypothetical protein
MAPAASRFRLVGGGADERRRAVVDQHARLETVDHLGQFLETIGAPVPGHVVKPDQVRGAVVGIGVRPVARGIVPAQFQSVSVGGVGDFAAEVPPERRGGDAIIRP